MRPDAARRRQGWRRRNRQDGRVEACAWGTEQAVLAADLNRRTPSTFPLRTAVVAISKGANSAFRQSGGKGVIVVKEEEPWEDIIAHEGSHGIFALHRGDPHTPLVPDRMAMLISEVFLELSNTTPTRRRRRRSSSGSFQSIQ